MFVTNSVSSCVITVTHSQRFQVNSQTIRHGPADRATLTCSIITNYQTVGVITGKFIITATSTTATQRITGKLANAITK